MARGINETDPVTSYVSTRWYRAPEILLASETYGSPADLFALGCVYAEMHTGTPLFAGFDELDQLRQIFGVVGTPNDQDWRDGIALLQKSYRVISWPPQRTTLEKIVTNHMQGTAVHLLNGLLRLDPDRRLTADQALDHAVFRPLMEEMAESSRKRSAPTTAAAAVAVTPSTITTSHNHHKKNKPAVVTISPQRTDHGLPFPALQPPPPPSSQQQYRPHMD
jgi:serine/threonine protein kinase